MLRLCPKLQCQISSRRFRETPFTLFPMSATTCFQSIQGCGWKRGVLSGPRFWCLLSTHTPISLGDVMDDDRQMFGCNLDLSKRFGYALNQFLLLLHTSAFPHVDFNYGHIHHLLTLRVVCAYLMWRSLILGFYSENQVFFPLFNTSKGCLSSIFVFKQKEWESGRLFLTFLHPKIPVPPQSFLWPRLLTAIGKARVQECHGSMTTPSTLWILEKRLRGCQSR